MARYKKTRIVNPIDERVGGPWLRILLVLLAGLFGLIFGPIINAICGRVK